MNEYYDLITSSQNELVEALSLAKHTVYKEYLNELSDYNVLPIDELEYGLAYKNPEDIIKLLKLSKVVYSKGEDALQKLSTIFYSTTSNDSRLIIIINSKLNEKIEFYLGIAGNLTDMRVSFSALKDGLRGNFPGTVLDQLSQLETKDLLQDIMLTDVEIIPEFATVSTVAALRDKNKTEDKKFIQGIERLIDAMQGKEYVAIFIAESVKPNYVNNIRTGYEEIYSSISPFKKSIWQYSENDSDSVMRNISQGISDTVSEGTSHTTSYSKSHTIGESKSDTYGLSTSLNINTSNSTSTGTSESRSRTSTNTLGANAKISEVGVNLSTSIAKSISNTNSLVNAITNGLGGSLSGNYNRSLGISENNTRSLATSNSQSATESKTNNITSTIGKTDTKGTGKSIQIEKENKSISEMLIRIENQLSRLREGEDYGLLSCGAYFLSTRKENVILAANTYKSLLIGEGSSCESGAVNIWDKDEKKSDLSIIKKYLARGLHPIFLIKSANNKLIPYTAATLVSGLELPIHMGLPTKSVLGLPVIEHTEFGRDIKIHNIKHSFNLGKLYHMGTEEEANVSLDVNRMASHTFITGSTGSGKSNCIYQILHNLSEKEVKFLVVEPVKGEYKTIFGGREDVFVYSTNKKVAPLLRLNPFSFPIDIHVLEHIDRLTEIFNACWPMYAAMPAVLKEAIEHIYREKGWDLITSECESMEYPTFYDLLKTLPQIMNESMYSNETKNDYTGALVTRIKSLTNGLNGQIFCSDQEIGNENLFDKNVIIDISRVASMETKSLIMGILIIKLQEYRMSTMQVNSKLNHVTVIEEAHNILKRTSYEQTQESSNIQGKSVEMIANAIAEMRTYGEGFIISDQSPGLMDMSVIRNTNTKIILRLPDETDRIIVGKAAALNNDQITEISKLPVGVSAIYQNEWIEPVLCKISLFDKQNPHKYSFQPNIQNQYVHTFLKRLLSIPDSNELSAELIDSIKNWISSINIDIHTKNIMVRLLSEEIKEEERIKILYELYDGINIAKYLNESKCEKYVMKSIINYINDKFELNDMELSTILRDRLIHIIQIFVDDNRFDQKVDDLMALERSIK